MADQRSSAGMRVESVNWAELLPFTRIFGSFKIAVDLPKLGLSLLLVVLLFLSGKLLDATSEVVPDEIDSYAQAESSEQFEGWLKAQWDERKRDLENNIKPEELPGVFSVTLRYQLNSFSMLVTAATSLRFGFDVLSGIAPMHGTTVVGALYRMFVVLPGWLWAGHPGFLITYVIIGLALWSLLGGAICRLIAAHATADRRLDIGEAVVFSRDRWLWFFAAPLLPLLVTAVIVIVLAAGGFVFFNWPVMDVIGALLFGLALVLAVIAAVVLLLFAAGAHLMYPALAVEGTDGFDAVARSFNYIFGRPWRWLFYTAVALVYGAITYLFVGLVVFLSIWLVHRATGWWVFRTIGTEGAAPVNRFDAMLIPPELGDFIYNIQWDALPPTGKAAAGIIWVWVVLLLAVMPAYAISYYFTAHTWIYLLLRRSADGTDLSEYYVEPPKPPMVKPAPPAAAPAAPASTESAPPPVVSPQPQTTTTEGSVESPPPPPTT